MELLEGLQERRSIRAFTAAPVSRALVEKILDAARWSPSWGNTQPWKVAVAGGGTVQRLTEDLVARFSQKVPPHPDVPMPQTFPDECRDRYMACAAGLFGEMGISREDRDRRMAHMLNMTRAFGAPVIIYLLFPADLEVPYTMFDLGAITHAIALAAHAHGLGTCIEAQLAHYPDVVRQHLGLPDTLKIVVGLALGHPNLSAPANRFRTQREPLAQFVTWVDV
jgi:nitroreductase